MRIRLKLHLAALSLLGLIASTPFVNAATYYVSTTGNNTTGTGSFSQPWRTIQKGVDSVTAGHTLHIRGGTYTEVITANNSGTSSTNKIVISGYPGETVIIDGQNTLPSGASPQFTPMFHVTGSYVEVRDLSVTRSLGRGLQVKLSPAGNVGFYNIKASYCWSEGIMVEKSSNTRVENCEVWQCAASNAPPNRGVQNWPGSLVASNSDFTVFKGCHVHECHGEGIIDLRSDNTIIEDCVVWDNYKINIYLDNSQYSTVRRNIVYATSNTLFWRSVDRPSPGILLSNEDYTGNSRYPNFLLNILVCNNFVYNTGEAIGVWHQTTGSTAQNVTIAYNTLVTTLTGATASPRIGFRPTNGSGTASGNVFKNNIVRVDDGELASGSAAGFAFSHNNWSSAVAAAYSNVNDVIGNPLVQLGTGTPNSNWLKLTSSSPGINKAQSITSVTDDFFLAARGSGPDIGAHEFAGGGSVPPQPTNLTATVAAAPNNINQINLSWGNVASETGYKIERKKGSGGTYAQIATTGVDLTAYNDTTGGAGTQYYYRVRAYNASGDSSFSLDANATTAEVTSGRQGHWKLDATTGTTATDSSGNANTGTLSGGPTWVAGRIGNGLNFDGVDDLVNAGSGATLDNLAAITVAAWINPTSMGEGGFGRIVQKAIGNNPGAGWRFSMSGANAIGFAVDYSTADLNRVSVNGVAPTGTWKHVVATWSGSATATNVRLFVDGSEVTYATTTNGGGTRGDEASASLFIGNSSDQTRTFAGKLDDVRVYNRVLSAAEIQAIYRAGAP